MMNIQKSIWKLYQHRALQHKSNDPGPRSFFIPGGLALVVTSRCNFSCKHCLRGSASTKDLPFEILQKLIPAAKKYYFQYASFSGGEPLLYPKLQEAIELLVRHGFMFSMITNGSLFKNIVPFLNKHKKNLLRMSFSLESADAKKHDAMRQEGSFKNLIEDFSICREERIPLRIITAVSPLNYEEICEIALFAKKKGARELVLTTVLPCPRSQDNTLVLDARRRQDLVLLSRALSRTIKLPIMLGADIRANNNIRLCNPLELKEIAIDPDGNVTQCCELSGFDDANIRKNATICSLKEMSFDEALKKISKHAHEFSCRRIDDLSQQADPEDIDLNSCFYCVSRLSAAS
jgi:MoaA/NifB/PqqE/SkfB family radical SAM enzyme